MVNSVNSAACPVASFAGCVGSGCFESSVGFVGFASNFAKRFVEDCVEGLVACFVECSVASVVVCYVVGYFVVLSVEDSVVGCLGWTAAFQVWKE